MGAPRSAETRISSSLTALLIAAVPLVGTGIALVLVPRERLTLDRGLGLLLGMAGVASIVGLGIEGASGRAIVEVLVVAVCYAVGPVILQRWLADLPPLGVIAASLGVSALVYVPVTALAGPGQAPSPDALASIVVLAVVCTAIAFLVFFALITEIGPVRATVITYVNPAVAAALGVVVLGEDFTLGMGLEFVLVTRRLGARHPSRPFTGRAAPHRPGACPDRLLTTVCRPGASVRITPRTSARDGSRRTPSCPPQAPRRPDQATRWAWAHSQEVGLDLPDEPAAELDAQLPAPS